ncbi:MAG TPA: hypothetical protein VGG71_08475 [Chitinophagaceae bacterium]
MEVHHHPKVEKKNFKEYFLEFLMIFLAVTLGFFAESFREHLLENKKEKDFIVSFKEDLVTDTAGLNQAMFLGTLQYGKLDTLYILLRSVIEQKPVNMNRLYYLKFRYASGLVSFKPDKRTISQIQSTGSFSLITNRKCRDSITVYENFNDDVIQENAGTYKDWLVDLNKMSQKIFDYDQAKTFGFVGGAEAYLNDSLKLNLITNDKTLLNEYANKVRSLMMILNILILTENTQLVRCNGLIDLLNKEYHLGNE